MRRIVLALSVFFSADLRARAAEPASPEARASSVHSLSYPAMAAVDGDPGTRWASAVGADRQDDLTLDFGRSVPQSGLRILWETAHAVSYRILLSDDGVKWRQVFARDNGGGGTEACAFPVTPARFLRVHCAKSGPYSLYSIWELEPIHPQAAAVLTAHRKHLDARKGEEKMRFRGVLADSGIRSVVFALRKPYHPDGHWYANFAYYCFDSGKKLSLDFGQLCRLDLDTGKVAVLVDDPKGSVRDPAVHYDGGKILFSYRKGGTEHFHLYEIQVDGTGLRQLTDGPFDDFEPCYLPDGGIVFVSSRARRWVNCWATQVATLHRCDADGAHLRMISANLEHDNTPWVLPDGRILYQRWEYVDRRQVEYHHLWTMNPDGTGQMVYYGNMHPGGVFIDAKPIPGSTEVLMIDSPGHGGLEHAGNVALVTSAYGPDERSAKRPVPGANDCRDPYPFRPDAFLVARKTQVLCMNLNGESFPVYEVPEALRAAGVWVHEPRPVRARPREPVIPSRVDLTKETGRLLLSDTYLGRNMTGVERGTIKKLLVVEALPKPVNFTGGMDPLTYGGSFTLERILGSVPVEADGSAYFEVPANRALFLIALDARENSVKRMQSFLTVMPGETQSCVGCHEERTGTVTPPGNRLAFSRAPSVIEPVPGIPDVFDFPRDIQPVLDRHCVRCHNPDQGPGIAQLTGDRGPMFSHAYAALTLYRQFVDGRNAARSNYAPYGIGAAASPIMKKLDGAHHEVKLSPGEISLIRYWIETAATYPGTYAALGTGSIAGYQINEPVLNNDHDWPESRKAGEAIERRCASCHTGPRAIPRRLADERGVSFWDPNWIDPALRWSRHLMFNLTRPGKSSVLMAPLAKAAGGYGVCGEVFASAEDPDYQAILGMLKAGQARLDQVKRFDMPGFQPRVDYLREMKRYGVLPPDFNLEKPPPVNVYELDREYWRRAGHTPPDSARVP